MANGYADVEMRDAINQGRLDGPRYQVSTLGIVWGGAATSEAPVNPLASTPVRNPEEARAAVREQIMRGADWIKLFPTGGYSFAPDGKAQFVLTLSDAGAAGAHRRDAPAWQEDGVPRARRRRQAQRDRRRLRQHRARVRPRCVRGRDDCREEALLRSDVRPLPRAVHGRQRREEHRRQVPDDPDLREGREERPLPILA
jgi:hypothetical protein